jgi:hypothetical protein
MDLDASDQAAIDSVDALSSVETDRYCQLQDAYAHHADTRPLLLAILEARHEPDDEATQFRAISMYLAELLSSNFLPTVLREAIGGGIAELSNTSRLGFDSPEVLRAGGFVPLLANKSQGDEQ